MKKRYTGKLQWQYFASYLALMLVVMTVLIAYAFNSFSRFHTKIVLDNYTNRLALIRAEQEEALSDMVAIASQVMDVTSGVPFDNKKDPEKAADLRAQLEAYRATHDALAGIYLHFFGDEFVHSASGSYLMDNFTDQMFMFSGIDGASVAAYMEDNRQMTMLPMQAMSGYAFQMTMRQRNMVPVFVPVSVSGGYRCGTAMFLVEDLVYNDWFTTLGGENKDVYVLKDDTVISSQQRMGVPTQIVLDAASSGDATLHHEGQTYHVLSLPGKTFSYRYVMLFSNEEILAGLTSSVKMLTLAAALVATAGLLFIHYFVQKRMKPIMLLHSMISDREPTGNELLEIRDGIQRLIEENAAMSSRMEDVQDLRKSDFVRRFLVGAFQSEDECLSYAERIQLNVDKPCYAVAIIAKPSDADYELTAEKINHLFDDAVGGAARDLSFQERVVLVAFADDASALIDFLEHKFLGLRACCGGVTMAISAVHSDLQEGQRAYLEAENAFELRFIKGNAQTLRFDLLVSNRESGKYNQQAVERLRRALHVGDVTQVSVALKDITKAMRGMQVSLFDFRCMYNDILNAVSSEARAQGVNEEDVYDLFKLSQCLSLEDLDAMLHQVCSRMVSGRVSTQAPVADGPVTRAHEIIVRRFSEPALSVSSIAAEVGMSDSKLSTEFKRVYRMTPLEYITRSRMHRARQLLRTTDMPVKDIALECGYYDISGFNRRFKTYTGMTPQQYRLSSDAVAEASALDTEEGITDLQEDR